MSELVRVGSFGQGYTPSLVDRFGVWLSSRQIRRVAPDLRGKSVGDFGCGYHATLSRGMVGEARQVTLIDLAISNELKAMQGVRAIEGDLVTSLERIEPGSLDLAMCISVLEHIWEPQVAVHAFYRMLKPGGVCLINVPSWRGKYFLEYSAFRLGLSPAEEMEDHKTYYDVRDLWPLLVRAGFRPSRIQCYPHKFGLNTFAICRKEEA